MHLFQFFGTRLDLTEINESLTSYFHSNMDYILVSANPTSDAQTLDELSVQHALKTSLLTVCGQTASAYIDILAFLDDEGVPQSTGKSAQVILRVNSADKGNVLAAIAYSQDQIKFSIKQQSKFIVSLLPHLQPKPSSGVAA